MTNACLTVIHSAGVGAGDVEGGLGTYRRIIHTGGQVCKFSFPLLDILT